MILLKLLLTLFSLRKDMNKMQPITIFFISLLTYGGGTIWKDGSPTMHDVQPRQVATSWFLEAPQNVTVYENKEVIFKCTIVESNFASFLINETFINDLHENVSNDFIKTRVLTVTAKREYNMTRIQCMDRQREITSEIAILTIQGPPGPIGELRIEQSFNEVSLFWDQPFSLLNEMTYVIEISTQNDNVNLTTTVPHLTLDNHFCGHVEVSVTPKNPAGKGEKVTIIVYTQENVVMWTYKILTTDNREITFTFSNCIGMDISIQLELTSNVIGCGGISTLRTLVVNSSVAYTFSTAEVRDNCHFNATITTYNATEVMILNITLPINTFEVWLRYAVETSTLLVVFAEGTSANRALVYVTAQQQTLLHVVKLQEDKLSIDLDAVDNVTEVQVFAVGQDRPTESPSGYKLKLKDHEETECKDDEVNYDLMPDLVGSSLSANGAELTQTCKRDKSNVTGCAVFCRTNDILTSHFYTFHEENEVLTQTFRLPGGTNRSECANVPLRNGELVNSNTTPQCIIIKEKEKQPKEDMKDMVIAIPTTVLVIAIVCIGVTVYCVCKRKTNKGCYFFKPNAAVRDAERDDTQPTVVVKGHTQEKQEADGKSNSTSTLTVDSVGANGHDQQDSAKVNHDKKDWFPDDSRTRSDEVGIERESTQPVRACTSCGASTCTCKDVHSKVSAVSSEGLPCETKTGLPQPPCLETPNAQPPSKREANGAGVQETGEPSKLDLSDLTQNQGESSEEDNVNPQRLCSLDVEPQSPTNRLCKPARVFHEQDSTSTGDSVEAVVALVLPAAQKWLEIGENVGIKSKQLEEIGRGYATDEDRLRKIVQTAMRKLQPLTKLGSALSKANEKDIGKQILLQGNGIHSSWTGDSQQTNQDCTSVITTTSNTLEPQHALVGGRTSFSTLSRDVVADKEYPINNDQVVVAKGNIPAVVINGKSATFQKSKVPLNNRDVHEDQRRNLRPILPGNFSQKRTPPSPAPFRNTNEPGSGETSQVSMHAYKYTTGAAQAEAA